MADYYVDAVNGLDTNDGSTGTPWKTFDKLQANLSPGDTGWLRDGDYGDIVFDENTSGTNKWGTSWVSPVTIKADTGHSPMSSSLFVYSEGVGAYLIFDGIYFETTDYNVDGLVHIRRSPSVKLLNLDVKGFWAELDYRPGETPAGDTTTSGIYITTIVDRMSDLEIDNCTVTDAERGIMVAATTDGNITITNNTLHHLAASGVSFAAKNYGGQITINDNHIYEQVPLFNGVDNSHGSGLSLRAVTVTGKRNIIHNFGTSGAIRTYEDIYGELGGYTDMFFENNLIYDCPSQYPVSFNDIGNNFTFRNNTVIGYHDPDDDGTFWYKHSEIYAVAGVTASTIKFKNNVMVCQLLLSGLPDTSFTNNVLYACPATPAGNIIVRDNTSPDLIPYFEDAGNFFVGDNNFNEYSYTYSHGINFNNSGYQLASGAGAIGYGDAADSPADDYFEYTRDGSPDAGCYEYQGTPAGTNYTFTPTVTTNDTFGFLIQTPHHYRYPENTVVEIEAIPNTGFGFDNWSGDVTGTTNPETVTMSANKAVTAAMSDIADPTLDTLTLVSNTELTLVFSEPLDQTTAEDESNYSITGGVTVISATLDNETVTIVMSENSFGSYTLTASGIEDLNGRTMTETEKGYTVSLPDPVSKWNFQDNAGNTTVADAVGANTGTLKGGKNTSQVSATGPGGIENSAFDFDGSVDYVNCGAGASLNIGGSITVAAMVNASSTGSIVRKLNSTKTAYGMYIKSTGELVFHTSTASIYVGSAQVPLNEQVFLGFTVNGTSGNLYINDSLPEAKACAALSTANGTVELLIGAFHTDQGAGTVGNLIDGLIAEVRIYDSELTAEGMEEVRQEMLAGDSPVPEGSTDGRRDTRNRLRYA